MDLQGAFPNEGEIAQIAKAEECEPARLLLRAVREERGKLLRQIETGFESLSDQGLRIRAAKAAALNDLLAMVVQAKKSVSERDQGESHEADS